MAIVGIDWMLKRALRSGSSSVFTLATIKRARAGSGDFHELGRDHLARSAPRRPEVDQHGTGRLRDQLIEFNSSRNINRFSDGRQSCLAFGTPKGAVQPLIKESIPLAAVGASADDSAAIESVGGMLHCRTHNIQR